MKSKGGKKERKGKSSLLFDSLSVPRKKKKRKKGEFRISSSTGWKKIGKKEGGN